MVPLLLLLVISGTEGLRVGMSMSLRKPLIAGNWKMNTDLNSAIELASELGKLQVLLLMLTQ
jgi:hypothetical protein